jgi:type I restriction enzyme, R subunit
MQKLLDDHVIALPAETIIKPVNINDRSALNAVIEEAGITTASKADRIASATKRTITEHMDEDPAFYMQFSEMLEQTIRDYRERRLSEKDYLGKVVDIAMRTAAKDRGRKLPISVQGNDDAGAFFGVLERLMSSGNAEADAAKAEEIGQISLALISIIKEHHIVDVWANDDAKNRMKNAIDDYFFDIVRDQKGFALTVEQLDQLQAQIMKLAEARFPS